MHIRLFCCICWVLGLVGCSDKLSVKEYEQFLADEKNGFRKTKIASPYKLQVVYQPAVYTAYQKSDGDKNSYARYLEEDKNWCFFQLSLGLEKQGELFSFLAQDEQAYQDWVYYFSYTFQKRIFLIQGEQKLPCHLYHFERSYDLHGRRNFILGFESQDSLGVSPGSLQIEATELNLSQKIPFTITNVPDLTF